MLTITGSLAQKKTFPADAERLHDIFSDIPLLLGSVPSVEQVESYEEGVYRIIMKRIGTFNFHVWLAADVQVTMTDESVTAKSLPFDPADPWIGDGVLLYEYNSTTLLEAATDATDVDHSVEVKIHVPLPGFLQVMPLSMIQGAADALMTQNLAKIVGEMEAQIRKII